MRDLLPLRASRERRFAATLVRHFELHGYELVQAPAFEYADVLERGLGSLEPHEVLRFVEPESGEVVALRPDVTPQLARIVATRLGDAPPPARLCYEGTVLRRPRARGRLQRQIPQAGIELLGAAGAEGDLEVLRVVSDAVRATGLRDFTLDLGHAAVAGQLLSGLDDEQRASAVEPLRLKDEAELRSRARRFNLSSREREALCLLPRLHGDESVFADARDLFADTPAEKALEELSALVAQVRRAALTPKLVIDLGEIRAFAYYSGMMFQLLAEGPGRPVASGGRYDGLLGRFGAPRPAAGGAIDVDHLLWALGAPPIVEPRARVLVQGAAEPELLAALRRENVCCAAAPEGDALAYARAWRYTHTLSASAGKGEASLRSLLEEGSAAVTLAGSDAGAIARAAAEQVQQDLTRLSPQLAGSAGREPEE